MKDLNFSDETLSDIEEIRRVLDKQPDKLIPLKAAAQILKITYSWMHQMVSNETRFGGPRIPSIKIRGRRYIQAKDLSEYLEPEHYE